MSNKLIRDTENLSTENLDDLLLVMAKNVEDALIKGGARPGIDYALIDLYQIAQPFALEIFKRNLSTISYAVRW